jgi:putative membrane protein insertion efficiency factor
VNPVEHILIWLVRLYRWTLSPAKTFLFGPSGECRFTPSCSAYALEAIQTHGALAGSWLAAKRVCRCHPWGGCGHDPVPEKRFQVSGFRFQVPGARGLAGVESLNGSRPETEVVLASCAAGVRSDGRR